MTRIFLVCLVTPLFATAAALAAQDDTVKPGAWSGIIVNSECTPDQAFAEAAECMQPIPGAKLSLYDDTTRQFFKLDPQQPALGHVGEAVTVRGRLNDDTIRVASLELLAGIGLPVGEKAPALSARDQFGREQNLQTLKGSHGTVLLFFRSADW